LFFGVYIKMKIKINLNETYETSKDEFTASEFLILAEKIKALTTQGQKDFQMVFDTPTSTLKTNDDIENDIENATADIFSKDPLAKSIYEMRKNKGMEFNQIAKEKELSTSKVRKIYTRIYSLIYNRTHKQSHKAKTKTTPTTQLSKAGVRKRGPTKVSWKDRNEVLKVLKIHYHGTKEDKTRYADNLKVTWNYLTKSFHLLIKRYDIKPYEIGLTRFKKQGEKVHEDTSKKKQAFSIGSSNFFGLSNKPELNKDEMRELISDADLVADEEKFIKFFELAQKTSVDESLVKETVLLLREFLIRKGMKGSTDDILNWLSSNFKSMKPIINPVLLESWLK
jgi:hypothetical protein